MPLVEMSPNVQEAERPRKRSHDEYAAEDGGAKENGTNGAHNLASPTQRRPSPSPAPSATADSSNPTSTSAAAQQQPPKRKRLTAAEKAAKADEEAKKKQEREDARLQKLADKARADKEKQAAKEAKQQERDEKRKKKEEEERRVREEKEAKERRAREEREKKERSQLRLQAFFTKPTMPKKGDASAGSGAGAGAGIGAAAGGVEAAGAGGSGVEASPITVRPAKKDAKKERTEYERMFQPFFVKEHVRMARSRPLLDDEGAEAKARILDEYVSGERGKDAAVRPFRPLEALQLPAKPRRAGKAHPPVRAIMEELQRGSSSAALEKLRGIPMKLIHFRQDVRPPYFGTLTCAPHELGRARMRRAGRRPCGRVLELQYDYDSEAEWQDDEPGDDLDDVDDEEEDVDEDDDMEEFLDDSEDAGVARRIFANGMEPERSLDQNASIDPFATHYWSPPKKAAKMPPPPPKNAQPKNAQPKNAFAALKAGDAAAPTTPAVQIPKPELLPDFRKAVLANQKLSKGAIVEVLGLQFDELSKAETRAMLEYVAEKGAGKGKVWELKEVVSAAGRRQL